MFSRSGADLGVDNLRIVGRQHLAVVGLVVKGAVVLVCKAVLCAVHAFAAAFKAWRRQMRKRDKGKKREQRGEFAAQYTSG